MVEDIYILSKCVEAPLGNFEHFMNCSDMLFPLLSRCRNSKGSKTNFKLGIVYFMFHVHFQKFCQLLFLFFC